MEGVSLFLAVSLWSSDKGCRRLGCLQAPRNLRASLARSPSSPEFWLRALVPQFPELQSLETGSHKYSAEPNWARLDAPERGPLGFFHVGLPEGQSHSDLYHNWRCISQSSLVRSPCNSRAAQHGSAQLEPLQFKPRLHARQALFQSSTFKHV